MLPEANRAEYDEVPQEVKEGLDVHFVRTYQDVFQVAFPGVTVGPVAVRGRAGADPEVVVDDALPTPTTATTPIPVSPTL